MIYIPIAKFILLLIESELPLSHNHQQLIALNIKLLEKASANFVSQ